MGYILIQPDVKPEGHEKDNLADGITKHTAKKVPKRHLITCGSRFSSRVENNYAVIELELTAIQLAVDKCWMYLAGTEFTAITVNIASIETLRAIYSNLGHQQTI